MAEVSENDEASKVCLVLEDIPIGALRAFVEDFTVLKTQERLMVHLPELRRLSVSLLAKGVGPALIVEAGPRTEQELAEKNERVAACGVSGDEAQHNFDEAKCTKALKSFIDRIVVHEQACPYTKSVDIAASGLEARGVPPGPVGYRFSDASDACAAVAVFIMMNSSMQNRIFHGYFIEEDKYFIDCDGLLLDRKYITHWAYIPEVE
jgi:hypothetical protein